MQALHYVDETAKFPLAKLKNSPSSSSSVQENPSFQSPIADEPPFKSPLRAPSISSRDPIVSLILSLKPKIITSILLIMRLSTSYQANNSEAFATTTERRIKFII